MQPAEFRAYHEPALELQEVKHGFILNALARIGGEKLEEVSYWTLGQPGECAIQLGRVSILLISELAKNQCHALAELTAYKQYPGVIGPDVAGPPGLIRTSPDDTLEPAERFFPRGTRDDE